MLLITRRDQDVIEPPVSGFNTTGSMEEGSYFLTCANASGFDTGDHVIVEIGGEAEGGLIDTVGVGGIQEAYGDEPHYPYYYYRAEKPLALCAQVMGKVGNVLQLSLPAQVATTNATVWFDNYYPWDNYVPDFYYFPEFFANKTIQFPAGTFAYSKPISFGRCHYAQILGHPTEETRIRAPRGCVSTYFLIQSAIRPRYANFTFEHQFKQHGWVLAMGDQNTGNSSLFGGGVEMGGCGSPLMHDMLLINRGQSGIAILNSSNARVFRCRSLREEPLLAYVQWAINDVECTDSIWYDCRADSPLGLEKGFEMFRSQRTTFVRCGGINAVLSSGGAADFLLDEFWSTVTENSGIPYAVVPGNLDWGGQSIIDVTNNVGSSHDRSVGGEIRNPRLVQEGYVNADNESLKSITIYPGSNGPTDYKNIRITGTDYTKALIEAPDMDDPDGWGGAYIEDGGAPNTEVSGVRLIGFAGQYGNIRSFGADCTVENCVADEIQMIGSNPTQSGNQTNAEYEA